MRIHLTTPAPTTAASMQHARRSWACYQIPAAVLAVITTLSFVAATAASASTYLPGNDGNAATTAVLAPAQHSTGSPIWQFVAVALLAAAVTTVAFLGLIRARRTSQPLPA